MEKKYKEDFKNASQEFISRISYIDKEEIIEFFNLAELPPHLSKTKYCDNDFPPEYHSLENPKNKNPILKKNDIIWKRIDEIYEISTSQVFVFKKFQVSEFSKLYQGIFSKNTYFLYALGILQLFNKNLIERLFLTDKYNSFGCYAVILNYNGEWAIINVDDYFPFMKSKNQLLFSKSEKNEMWLMILEKAYAKLYGSYENIQNGNLLDTIFDLTGINFEFFDEKNFFSYEEMIKKIQSYHEMSIFILI